MNSPTRKRCAICAQADLRLLNCGYSRGFSVLEVIDAVERVSGVDFKVEFAGRRLADLA
jgi:UDP-glucose 4-epimerase